MTRRPLLLFLLLGLAVAGLLTACATQLLREPRRPAQTFSHEAHRNILGPQGFACVLCHPFTVDVLEPRPARAASISRSLLTPGQKACHHCHTDVGSPVATVRRCTLCHDDIGPLRPADHDALWSNLHGLQARVDSVACNDCHRESDFVQCHVQRNTAVWTAHDPTYGAFHAVEARLDPGRCQRCHTAGYCTGCHQRGGRAW